MAGQEDPRYPSGRRVHQRYHPRDQQRAPQGQRCSGDGRRVTGHPCAPSNHDTDSKVAPVKTLIASHRLASAADASIGILLGVRLRSSSSGDDDDDATREGTAGRHGRSRSIGLCERTFITRGKKSARGRAGENRENPKIQW